MKHAEVRQHIITTAAHLFYTQGYNSTGINEIIKEAGIAKATLYNHFPSKEDICLAYLQHKDEVFMKDITVFVEQHTGKEQVYALFNFLFVFFKQKDFNGCWCINTMSEIPKDNERIRTEIQQQKEAFILFIRELIAKNDPKQTERSNTILAQKIYILYESAVSESRLHEDTWPIETGLSLCQTILP